MSIKKSWDELHHVLSRNEKNQSSNKNQRSIPKHSQLQKLNIECKIIDSFITEKQYICALRYFLKFKNTAISDWSWIEEMSRRSMKTKFQTETIHKISSWVLKISNPFEASLIYQICNIKDQGVKDNIQSSINNYYSFNNSALAAEEAQQEAPLL